MSRLVEDFFENLNFYSDRARLNFGPSVSYQNKDYPLVSLSYGSPTAPTLLIVGGIHGLERIGAQLAISLLRSFHERLAWDIILQSVLEKIQLVFVPVANPVGYFATTRSNGDGIDLMRNAPLDAEHKPPWMLGGQKKSARWPWYRGDKVAVETEFIFKTVENIFAQSNTLISVDLHSGFGFKDQLWFPFAYSHNEFDQLAELNLLIQLFEKTFPYHIYKIEPQSQVYLTHGDLWDYSFLNIRKSHQVYIPLTLEMGSWIWVKKNPLQLFSRTGLFNPIKAHRMNRTLRRHRPLFDFLTHSLAATSVWANPDEQLKSDSLKWARERFFNKDSMNRNSK